MACCGPSKTQFDLKKLDELKNNKELITLKLVEDIYKFDPTIAKWKSN